MSYISYFLLNLVIIFHVSDSGLIEIISPPAGFYPDMSSLKQTLGNIVEKLLTIFPWWSILIIPIVPGDDMERVTWRSKQALDFSFLMMYAKDRGTFYVQLEDDVLTKKVKIYSYLNLPTNYKVSIIKLCHITEYP